MTSNKLFLSDQGKLSWSPATVRLGASTIALGIFMDNTIIVAIIGASVAFLSIVVTALLGFLTWSRNIRFQILKDERDRLESKFEVALELLGKGLQNETIDGRLAAMCHHEFPENVSKEFVRLLDEKIFSHEQEFERKKAYFLMAHEMSKAVKEYNVKIQETAEVVDKEFAAKLAVNIIRTGLVRF